MKILIINIDSIKHNLALKKLELYHQSKGDTIVWNAPLWANWADKIYVSSIFSENIKLTKEWEGFSAEIGGTGYDIKKKLPPHIHKLVPRINVGFTTRGCIRKCPWCIVPEKEGNLRRENHIREFWDGKSKRVEILDNNCLADKEWFIKNTQFLISHKLELKENGMDIRLVDEEITERLSHLRFGRRLHFSFDDIRMEKMFREKIQVVLKKIKASRISVYVLTGFNSSFEEDMERVNIIKGYKCTPYVMLYNKQGSRLQFEFQRWVNSHCYVHIPFEKFLRIRKTLYLFKQGRYDG